MIQSPCGVLPKLVIFLPALHLCVYHNDQSRYVTSVQMSNLSSIPMFCSVFFFFCFFLLNKVFHKHYPTLLYIYGCSIHATLMNVLWAECKNFIRTDFKTMRPDTLLTSPSTCVRAEWDAEMLRWFGSQTPALCLRSNKRHYVPHAVFQEVIYSPTRLSPHPVTANTHVEFHCENTWRADISYL